MSKNIIFLRLRSLIIFLHMCNNTLFSRIKLKFVYAKNNPNPLQYIYRKKRSSYFQTLYHSVAINHTSLIFIHFWNSERKACTQNLHSHVTKRHKSTTLKQRIRFFPRYFFHTPRMYNTYIYIWFFSRASVMLVRNTDERDCRFIRYCCAKNIRRHQSRKEGWWYA